MNSERKEERRPEYTNHEQYTFNYETFREFIDDIKEALFSIVFMK